MTTRETVSLEVTMEVRADWLADPEACARIATYRDMVVVGFLDERTMRPFGGSMTLTQAAVLLFPDET